MQIKINPANKQILQQIQEVLQLQPAIKIIILTLLFYWNKTSLMLSEDAFPENKIKWVILVSLTGERVKDDIVNSQQQFRRESQTELKKCFVII